MNIAYRWLQDYVKTTTDPEVLGEKFRMTSSEMEGIHRGYNFPKELVVGYVEKLIQHPNADRLRVATVKTGGKARTIVCGAPNIAEGQYIIVALPGAILHPVSGAAVTIKESKIRDITSEGMCCSAAELGLQTHAHGIIVLSKPYKPGTSATEALELDDTVLDLEITPNRPDLLSYHGLAREVATFEKRPLLDFPIADTTFDTAKEDHIEARVEATALCSRYSALAIEVPAITDSPWWLQARLILAGVKPLNAIVDVTNYVMLECGQPLHAFDSDKLPKTGKSKTEIAVQAAKTGQTITLLDGSTRALTPEDAIITDGQGKPIALAGIMGGQESAIDPETTKIILESATFHGPAIRRTSRRLGLRSEASLRFEKGLDSELTVTALKRAVYLLQEICGAVVTSKIHDRYNHHAVPNRPRISVSFNRIQQLLGIHIGAAECKTILQKLGFQLQAFTKSGFDATPPSWRADILLPEDVIEEIIRIWGYERVPLTLPSGSIIPPEPNARFLLRSNFRHALAQLGGYELVSQAFVSGRSIEQAALSTKDAIAVSNPLSKEGEFLVSDHLVFFLQNISTVNREQVPLCMFEAGKVFMPPYDEIEHISLLHRASEKSDSQIRTVKTMLQRMLEKGNINASLRYAVSASPAPYFEKETALDISVSGKKVGQCGYIDPIVLSAYKIRSGRALFYVNLNFDLLATLPTSQHFYTPEPKYPKIERDLTVILNTKHSYTDLAAIIDTDTMAEWYLTNTYTGKPLSPHEKSYTLHFTYTAPDRTLTDIEVEKHINHLSDRIRSKLNAVINL